MPIDPTGTQPGVTPAEQPKPFHMKCRREGCDSILATDVTPPGMPGKRYQCVKCRHVWGVNPGGPFNVF